MDDWMLYQIGGPEANKYRYIVTRGFQDHEVGKRLQPYEFIDCVDTLSGILKGEVEVVAAGPGAAAY